MNKIKKIVIFIKNKIKEDFKRWLSTLKSMVWWQRLIYIVVNILITIGLVILLKNKLWWIALILVSAFKLVIVFLDNEFFKNSSGNGIVYGSRGSGKTNLMQHRAKMLGTYFSNVPFGYDRKEFVPLEYFNVLSPNTIRETINGIIEIIDKAPYAKYEGIDILWDDLGVYAPNYEDAFLKKTYESLGLIMAVNRQLFNHGMMVNVQDRERPYKLIKELQTDYSIKALKTYGRDKYKQTKKSATLWHAIPVLRNYLIVKYRYYEEVKSAESGVLPFKGMGVINEAGKTAYLTAGQATKEDFKARHGVVKHRIVFIKKKTLKGDSRYFHKVFFGITAEDWLKAQ